MRLCLGLPYTHLAQTKEAAIRWPRVVGVDVTKAGTPREDGPLRLEPVPYVAQFNVQIYRINTALSK